ncbi:MAG: glycosyltransferase family 4 protein [Acidimicrobiia bacterium]
MNVCMLVKNSFEYDARVTKEAKALIEAGHQVTVVAIHVPLVTKEREVTPEGIQVVRVSRLQFGLAALNRLAARGAAHVERRHTRLTGRPIDRHRAEKLGVLQPASTSTPGAHVPVVIPEEEPPAVPPSPLRRAWGSVSTATLRGLFRLAQAGYRSVRFLVGRQGLAVKTWAINRRFLEAALATGADVYHAHDLNTLYVGTLCKRKTGAKLVYDSHELATGRNRMGPLWRAWCSYWEGRGIPQADAVIMASPGYAHHAARRYRIPTPTVVRNVPERMEPDPRWDLRAKLGIPAHQRVLVYQGSIQENRGIEQTIEAVTRLEDCVLVVIGYGYHRPALEALVRERGLEKSVRFFGPVPNDLLISYTASGEVGMCPIINSSLSYYHSLPNKLYEYLMAGVPIVASDFPEMGGLVREEQVGEVCDPSDPVSIAEAVRRVIDDPEAAARYRENAREAVDRYNWSAERQRLLEVYQDLGR